MVKARASAYRGMIKAQPRVLPQYCVFLPRNSKKRKYRDTVQPDLLNITKS